jgi:hypothetical protein
VRWWALAAALVLTGCGGSERRPRPTPTPTPTATAAPRPTDEALLQRALDTRASAVRAPGLGVHDVTLRLEDADVRGDRAMLRVRLAYRVRGVRGTFGSASGMWARRDEDGRWRIGRRIGSRDRAPWQADDYVAVPGGHFVIWMPRGLDPGPLPAALEQGYARLRAELRRGALRRRYLVVVARDPGHAREITSSIRGLSGLTALTDTQVRLVGETERVDAVASQRLLVIWPTFSALTAEQQRQTVTHELTHAVLAPVTSGRVPAWLSEGIALYVSGDRRTPSGRRPTLRGLSGPDAIGRLDGTRQSEAYARASAAAFLIAERYGRAKLLALYTAFNRDSLPGMPGDPATVDRALRRVLGISLRRLERDIP